MNILVIDDDVMVVALLEEILKQEGHIVTVAYNQAAGFKKFNPASIELVMVDVNLTQPMDGCDLARKLKKATLQQRRFIPIILLTGLSDDLIISDCMDQGADDLIIKPFNRNLLEAKVRAWERVISYFETRIAEQNDTLQHTNKRSKDVDLTLEELDALRVAYQTPEEPLFDE